MMTPLPAQPSTLVLFLAAVGQTHRIASINLRMVAIAKAHRIKSLPSPTDDEGVKRVWRGLRRRLGVAQEGKAPLMVDDLRLILAEVGSERLIDIRDRALLLVGFLGAFRRSELVALDRTDVEFARPDELDATVS